MADKFELHAVGLESPAIRAVAITPNDSADLAISCRGVYVGTGGDLRVTTTGGDTITFPGLPDGSILPVRCSRVFATDTTASGLIGLS